MHESFRNSVRDALNEYSKGKSQIKTNIIEKHLKVLESFEKKSKYSFCKECGQPSQSNICKACEIEKSLNA
jgi:hypothetical protein